MAKTNSIPLAGQGIIGRGSNSGQGRFGLRAKVALGVVTLGCVAALAFSGLRAGDSAPSSALAPAAPITQQSTFETQRFLQDNLYLPDGSFPVVASADDQQRFLAWNTQLPTGGTPSAVTIEQRYFLELNTQLPDGTLIVVVDGATAQRFLDWNMQLPTGGAPTPLSADQQRFLELNLDLPTGGISSVAPSNRSTYR